MQLAHPLRVPGGQVVVDGHHVDALASQGVQIDGKSADEGLSLTRLHLGDPPEVQRHATHQLGIEVPLTQHPPGCLPDQGEGLDEDVLQALPLVEALAKHVSHGSELFVRARLHLRLEGVDQWHQLGETTDFFAFTGAKDFREHTHGLLTLPSSVFISGSWDPDGPARALECRGPSFHLVERAIDTPGPVRSGGPHSLPQNRNRVGRSATRMGSGNQTTLGFFQLMFELVHHEVNGHQRQRTRRMSPDHPTVAKDAHFAAFLVSDSRVVLLGEVHLGTVEPRAEATESADFLLGQGPHLVGNDPSAMCDDNVHFLTSIGVLCLELQLRSPGPPDRSLG